MNIYSRVYAAVDLDAILRNVEEMRRIIHPNTKIMAVIKTDGYGHGAVPIGRELERLSYIWGYAVATVEEGMILRRNGLEKPILVLGAAFPEQYRMLAEQDLRPAVYSTESARQISETAKAIGRPIRAHIKIDTGMSRLGFQVEKDAAKELAQIAEEGHIIFEGAFTHFATSDEKDKTMANAQLAAFARMREYLADFGLIPEWFHASNSAGILDLPQANLDIVRAGISLYGLWPSDEVNKERIRLWPVLSLRSRIVFLKELPAGRTISYGAAYTVKRPSRIATVPVGYGDGYPRSLSNKGYVLVCGRRAPICGRICMDQFMVDVTDIPEAAEGDEVVLVGRDGAEQITVEELGDLSGRFNYEFVCDLGKRIPRVYYKGGIPVDHKDYFGE